MTTTQIIDSPLGDIRVTVTNAQKLINYNGDRWEHYSYTAWVTYQGRTLRTPYSRGTGLAHSGFDFREILTSIALDATSADMSFHDFCDEFGYDSNSIKARHIYDACDRMWHSIKRVFHGRVREFYDYAETLDN